MDDPCSLRDDVWLKGILVVRAVGRRDGRPQEGKRVSVRACGFV
jgi:hypothetical protein